MSRATHAPSRHFHRVAWAAAGLAFAVIVFGAFVRLSHAGLSCPDWPTCYGKATWPTQPQEIADANDAFPARAVETHKAWREQVHRHLAATLGALVLGLALASARRNRRAVAWIAGGVLMVALSIVLYIRGLHAASALLVLGGELALLTLALRRGRPGVARVATGLLAVVVFQALLGMWTVTWLLKPIVVMGHLLGGLTTLSLLVVLAWWTTPGVAPLPPVSRGLSRLLWSGLALLVLQIALGGWTSANYAALACGLDFPTCLGRWWPETDFREAFVPWRGIGVDYEGGVLDGPARVAIQLLHRAMALVVLGALGFVSLRLRRLPGLERWGAALGVLLAAQVTLGIANVLTGLPLWVAAAHNAGAALLLVVLVGLLARLNAPGSLSGAD